MIKKEQSLKTNFEFNITKKYGKYQTGALFHCYILEPRNYTGITKLGVVISLKFDKRATQRNRVKRLFKQAFRNFLEINKDKHLWIVVYPKANSKYKKYEEISIDVDKTLSKYDIS